jgi:hypothetical protein
MISTQGAHKKLGLHSRRVQYSDKEYANRLKQFKIFALIGARLAALAGLCWVGLCWVGLGWVGLGWVGLGASGHRHGQMKTRSGVSQRALL